MKSRIINCKVKILLVDCGQRNLTPSHNLTFVLKQLSEWSLWNIGNANPRHFKQRGKGNKMQFACCLGFVIVIGMHILDACWKINDENKNKW